MKKEKDMRLVNIYIKIHNKKTLTMDDLAYLAKYNPECFRKTCDNLIYNIPATKSLVTPPQESAAEPQEHREEAVVSRNPFHVTAEERARDEAMIREFLENLKKMEKDEITAVQSVDVSQVKDLVGNLYMEMMFPHSGMQGYFATQGQEPESTFNVRA